MKQLQLIHDEIAEKSKEKKEISEMYKDALSNVDEYSEIIEKMAELREKKTSIEDKVKNQLGKSWEKFEDIESEIKAEKQQMTDVALTNLMDGKTVEVTDSFGNRYEPVWGVKFVKTK